ncbi:hypothetical protein [Marinobacter sp. MIT932201]|uniref:hypothetical protein n=1 Tax=Marinobacter sp. MIT932201 TaxID=3096995 RepID=UPI0039997FFC
MIRVEDLALGSMRKLKAIQDWLRSHPTDTVPMPQSKDQARAMALTGMKWLEDNSPGELVHVGGVEPIITNEMKAECMGEFEILITEDCGRCLVEGLDENCEQCDGELVYQRAVTVPWDTCKDIYKAMAKAANSQKAPNRTPSARWREAGETDPHEGKYDGERALLCKGDITDDELANEVYLYPNIGNLTAAKERIRWLSRRLEVALSGNIPTSFAGALKDVEALKTILVDSVRLREPDFIIGDPQDPYLIRYWLRRDRPEGSIYLHCIRKSDDDRALHDHPWSSTSLVLQGTLREILPDGSRLLTPGCIVSRSAEQAHRLEVVDGPVWTLFITGAVEREWGFHCPNGWVHWKEFTDPATNGQQIGQGCGDE